MLNKAIHDYLQWMTSIGYARSTRNNYQKALVRFQQFVEDKHIPEDKILTWKTLQDFENHVRVFFARQAVRGLARYLFQRGLISSPIYKDKKPKNPLPTVFEEYVQFHEQARQVGYIQMCHLRATLSSLNKYLQAQEISLEDLNVLHMDSFLAERNKQYAPRTRMQERSVLRGFLRYLYQEKGMLRRDLSALIQGPPVFARSKPPKFLTPEEIEQLFASIDVHQPRGLRSYAMVHLAFSLGLRPKEISQVSLDDISFQKKEISIPERKNFAPATLPLPGTTIKALAAYMTKERPKDPEHRFLLCNSRPPYGPLTPMTISLNINACFKKAGIKGSAYWLRHTYAQNLLQADASIFEIKEMLGHDTIKTSKRYLSIHTKLMRKVLFDEEL